MLFPKADLQVLADTANCQFKVGSNNGLQWGAWTQADGIKKKNAFFGPDGSIWCLSEWVGRNESAGMHQIAYRSTDLGRTFSPVAGLEFNVVPILASINDPANGFRVKFLDENGKSLVGVFTQGFKWPRGSTTLTAIVFVSDDYGSSWSSVVAGGLPYEKSLFFELSEILILDRLNMVWNIGGSFYRSSDGGRNWQKDSADENGYEFRVFENNKFIRQANRYLYSELSIDQGRTWRAIAGLGQSFGNIDYLKAVPTAKDVWTLQSSIALGMSLDDLASVQERNLPTDQLGYRNALEAIWFFDSLNGLAVNASGVLLKTSDGGRQWTFKQGGFFGATVGDLPLNGSKIQFVGSKNGWLRIDGKMFRTTDGGETWVTVGVPGKRFAEFQFVDEKNGFSIGYDEAAGYDAAPVDLLATVDGGATWSSRKQLKAAYFYVNKIAFRDAKRGVLAVDGVSYLTEDGGLNWSGDTPSGNGFRVNKMRYAPDGRIWATEKVPNASSNTVLVSKDDGRNWAKANISGSLEVYFTDVLFFDANRGWAIGSNGKIFATVDGGKEWTEQISGSTENVRQVFFVDAKTGWLLGREGSLKTTGSAGGK